MYARILVFYQKNQDFNTKDKKVTGNWIALPATSLDRELFRDMAIDNSDTIKAITVTLAEEDDFYRQTQNQIAQE